MAKTVINLVKELGAKNTSEVMALLEQVGVDTHAEGFGVMTRIEDDVIGRIQQMRQGGGDGAAPAAQTAAAPAKAAPSRRQIVEDTAPVDLQTGVKRTNTKDFFGSRQKAAPPAPAPTNGGAAAAAAGAAPAPAQREGAQAASAAAVRQVRSEPGTAPARPPQQVKPDLSGGPRIISM